MIKDKTQKQEGGDSSSNIQAENVNVHYGLSYSDVRDIATDIFRDNFIQLKDEAAQIATERAEEITEKIIDQLKNENPDTLQEFAQPGMQDALFTAQKEYAKSGDTELGDLLVDIVVDRAKTSERNMLQIVLDESLQIAPKLTIEQLDTLTLLFLLIRTRNLGARSFKELEAYFFEDIFPFVDNLLEDHDQYSYLEYLRCGHIRAGDYGKLEESFRNNYKGFFSKGFTKEELVSKFETFVSFQDIIMPCFHDRNKFQIGVSDDKTLDQTMTKRGLSKEVQDKLKQFFNKTTMDSSEIKVMLIQLDNRMKVIFDTWQNTRFKKFELSSVGIAIAHANYRRKTGNTLDLSIWIK